jgi:hypothetical protein
MPTAQNHIPVTLPEPPSEGSLEVDRRVRQRVKAPFVLTTMGGSSECSWLWLWARRGRQWVVDEEFRVALVDRDTHRCISELAFLRVRNHLARNVYVVVRFW